MTPFETIVLSDDEKSHLAPEFSFLVDLPGDITQENFDLLTSEQKEGLIQALSPEKQAAVRRYQADLNVASGRRDVAQDVQAGVASVAATTVLTPAADQDTSSSSSDSGDSLPSTAEAQGSGSITQEDATNAGYAVMNPEDLPETPNTLIAVFKLMAMGYYPAEAVKVRWWKKGDPSFASKWIFQGPQRLGAHGKQWRDGLVDSQQEARLAAITGANKAQFERDLAAAGQRITDQLDRTIGGLPQNKSLQDQLQSTKNMLMDIVHETDPVKRGVLLSEFNNHVSELARVARIDPAKMSQKLSSADRNQLVADLTLDQQQVDAHHADLQNRKGAADLLGTTLAEDDAKVVAAQTEHQNAKDAYNTALRNAGIDAQYHGKPLADIEIALQTRLAEIGDPAHPRVGSEYQKNEIEHQAATRGKQAISVLLDLTPANLGCDPELKRLDGVFQGEDLKLNNYITGRNPKKKDPAVIQLYLDERNKAQAAFDARKTHIEAGPPSLVNLEAKIQSTEATRIALTDEYRNKIPTQRGTVGRLIGNPADPIHNLWGDIAVKEGLLHAIEAQRTANKRIRDAATGISDADVQAAEGKAKGVKGQLDTATRAQDRISTHPANWKSTLEDWFTKNGMTTKSAHALMVVLQNKPDPATKFLLDQVEGAVNHVPYDAHRASVAINNLDAHLKANMRQYSESVAAIEKVRVEAEARRNAIKAEMTRIDSGSLTPSEIDTAKKKITQLVGEYNTWVTVQNKAILKYGAQIESVPGDLIKAIKGTSYANTAAIESVEKLHAKMSATDKVAGRLGAGMMGVGAYEIGKLMLNAKTEEDKHKANMYALDLGVSAGSMAIPIFGNMLAGGWDIGQAINMFAYGEDIAGNKVTNRDAAIRLGLGAVSFLPFVGQSMKYYVTGSKAIKAANTMIKGGEIVGKTAAIGFPVLYASEKLSMTLFEVPAQAIAAAKPQQSH
ncbi:MAG: hypothetical protein U0518_00935 [Candidatus Gracilibacteria bacterium]